MIRSIEYVSKETWKGTGKYRRRAYILYTERMGWTLQKYQTSKVSEKIYRESTTQHKSLTSAQGAAREWVNDK